MPAWLEQEPAELLATGLPLNEALQNSLFYLAARDDGNSVKFLGGFIHSFIYADYGMEKQELDDLIKCGFAGYRDAGQRPVNELSCWEPKIDDQYVEDRLTWNRYREDQDRVKPRFATWYIFERSRWENDAHGPKRFSLIYICGDGVAARRLAARRLKLIALSQVRL